MCLYSKEKNKTTLEDFLIIYYYYVEYYKEKYYNKDVLYKEEYFLASLGVEQGTRQRIEQEIVQGAEQNKISVAKKMIKENISTDIITKVTGLSTKTIKQLML